MARPRSEDKRQTILQAAVQLFAEEGLNAATSRIAKVAGVADGTIFTYFASKDELMNQLYLELKRQLRSALVLPPDTAELRERLWSAWRSYVYWAMSHPCEYQVLAKLSLSENISETTRVLGSQAFCDVSHLLDSAMSQGVLRHQSADFVGALMASMANTTMEFIKQNPNNAEGVCHDGFSAFWLAITSR